MLAHEPTQTCPGLFASADVFAVAAIIQSTSEVQGEGLL